MAKIIWLNVSKRLLMNQHLPRRPMLQFKLPKETNLRILRLKKNKFK